MQRTLGNRSASSEIQRYREFDKVPATKEYANGGVGIDGETDDHHFSMNPRGPDSPVANHFNEVHVTFDKGLEGDDLDWDARPHFYFSDDAAPKYIPKEGTAANVRFRREHPDGEEAGWDEFEQLKEKSKKLVTKVIPKLPEYEGKTIPDVQEVHEERARKAAEEAAAKKKAEEAAAAEKLADAEAEKAGKKRLQVVYQNSRHKKPEVESYGRHLKEKTGAVAMAASKAQGRGASACTVILEFGDYATTKSAKEAIGTTKDTGNGEALTVTVM